MAFIKIFVFVSIPLLALDALWLGILSRNFYAKELGGLLASPVNLKSALVVYILFALGLTVFVVAPNLNAELVRTVLLGALFGFAVYGVYDFTNLATIRSWSLVLSLVDLVWGTVLGGAVVGIARLLLRLF